MVNINMRIYLSKLSNLATKNAMEIGLWKEVLMENMVGY